MTIPAIGSTDCNFDVFLLLGQSNMVGPPPPEAQDLVANPRVLALAFSDCEATGRKYNQWATALPPLHNCDCGVGPGDHFGKAMAEALPTRTIGLVPCAVVGCDIDYYVKGIVSRRRHEFTIPPDDAWPSAYEWVLSRAKVAQERGVVRGILFHHGESDNLDPIWVEKVAHLVQNLRVDLGIGQVPFIAAELLYGGSCSGHNQFIRQLPERIPNAETVTAAGLRGIDDWHFDLVGQRELGRRYAEAMLRALR